MTTSQHKAFYPVLSSLYQVLSLQQMHMLFSAFVGRIWIENPVLLKQLILYIITRATAYVIRNVTNFIWQVTTDSYNILFMICCIHAQLPIGGGIQEDSKIFFLFSNENMHCDLSLEPSRQDGSNDGSQCRICGKIRK